MKTAIATVAAIGLCAFASPAFAYTLNGTMPAVPGIAQIHLQQPIPKDSYVKLTLTVPKALSLGIPYEVYFCVGPTSNCLQAGISQAFPGGQQIIAIYESGTLATNGIWLSQPTRASVSYTLEVDYLQ